MQMPPGVPVATVAIDGAKNAAILAAKILAAGDETIPVSYTHLDVYKRQVQEQARVQRSQWQKADQKRSWKQRSPEKSV